MSVKRIVLLILLLLPLVVFGQKTVRVNKYTFAFDVSAGYSFPNFKGDQDVWKGAFYPAGSVTLLFRNRLSKHWQVDVGAGITAYALVNKGPVDSYVFNFASPHIMAGMQYMQATNNRFNAFAKLATGLQLGYNGSFVDEFELYKVEVKSPNQFICFVRPEIGIYSQLKNKVKGQKFHLGYELSVFYRYNVNALGTAVFIDNNSSVVAKPRGDIIGVSFKLSLPMGKKKLKMKLDVEDEHVPKVKVQSPRYF